MLAERAACPSRQVSELVVDHGTAVAGLQLIRIDMIDLEGVSGAAAARVAQLTAACATIACSLC